ncbi:MAG: SpoIIIAH-like family protein [Oscillospiraceae bacterium]|nr:SpoIIIAH-like family protein [Oscillospiraceae bacterium]
MKHWKNWKKNLVAAGVLVTVCCGIYLNWLYAGGEINDLENTLNTDKVMSDELLDLGESVEVNGNNENEVSDYFAAVRLSRQQARDSAISLLQEAMAYGDETQLENSNAQLEKIIQTALTEAQIESLIIAKGYADCVVYISESGVSIAVAAPEGGIQTTDVALIADIVLSQSDFTMNDIRVVEVL